MPVSSRKLLATLALALFCSACASGGSPTPAIPSSTPIAATAAAATSNARVEAWAIATGTALRLTAIADSTPTLTPPAPSLSQPFATADPSLCSPQTTDCAPTINPLPATTLATPTMPAPRSSTATPPPAATAQPTPVPATPSPSVMDCYNQPCQRELVSPDGQRRWPETCNFYGLDLVCTISFPNGNVSARFGWPLLWSADGQFLAVPEGGTHDSPAGGYEIWNMAEGSRTAVVDYNFNRQSWSPTGHTLAYVKRLTDGTQAFHLLDAATSADPVTRQCPTWATDPVKISDDFDWRTVCDNWVPPAGQPVILSFSVNPTKASPGQSVTVNWTSANASSAELTTYSASSAPGTLTALPPNGSLVVPISKDEKLAFTLNLTVRDQAGQSDQRGRYVKLLCLEAFFFSNSFEPISGGCPYRPAAFVAGVEQAFENGRMLWLAPLPPASTALGNGPGATIYVLYNAGVMDAWGVWQAYEDFWVPGQPKSDPTLQPPAGLLQPTRGFGKIWRETPGLRDKLGWAKAPEQGYANGAYQTQWRYTEPPGDFYLRAADQSILYFQLDGYWSPLIR